jgi:hypothetical protein
MYTRASLNIGRDISKCRLWSAGCNNFFKGAMYEGESLEYSRKPGHRQVFPMCK